MGRLIPPQYPREQKPASVKRKSSAMNLYSCFENSAKVICKVLRNDEASIVVSTITRDPVVVLAPTGSSRAQSSVQTTVPSRQGFRLWSLDHPSITIPSSRFHKVCVFRRIKDRGELHFAVKTDTTVVAAGRDPVLADE
jgi:hypothetical protein